MKLFLAGDVMTGRGIDQILPHPGDARLHENYVRSALDYVALAEGANGSIPRPVRPDYVWGDALGELDRRRPDVRIVNLETAITARGAPEPKGINYRMHPGNIGVLTAAGLDACVLANNHVLDWGPSGLLDTLDALRQAGIKAPGAGRNQHEAAAPLVLPVADVGRVILLAFGTRDSGIPPSWAARASRPGVNLLPDLTPQTVAGIAETVHKARLTGDIVVASIHWGSNWGYGIPPDHRAFAQGLIERGAADIVHGHSSHHAIGMEVYRGKLVLYGCGDLINDYEGIGGHEAFRSDLVLTYFPVVRAEDGTLSALEMVPFRLRRFRLERAGSHDADWLAAVLAREGRGLGTHVTRLADGSLGLEWG